MEAPSRTRSRTAYDPLAKVVSLRMLPLKPIAQASAGPTCEMSTMMVILRANVAKRASRRHTLTQDNVRNKNNIVGKFSCPFKLAVRYISNFMITVVGGRCAAWPTAKGRVLTVWRNASMFFARRDRARRLW